MQPRSYIIAFLIVALVAAATVPRADAEPLTIMAIAGLVTVLSVSSVDMAVHNDDSSNKDMRAQQEETAPMRAGAEADTKAFIAAAPTIAAPSVAAP
jgi:hypothetical protein